MKEASYKSLVRPILEYGSSVWDPHYIGLNDDLESVQSVQLGLCHETGSITGILEKIKMGIPSETDEC